MMDDCFDLEEFDDWADDETHVYDIEDYSLMDNVIKLDEVIDELEIE